MKLRRGIKHSPSRPWHRPRNLACATVRALSVGCCATVLALAGCSPARNTPDPASEAGRGTFVSTNGQAVTAVYFTDADLKTSGMVRLTLPDKTEVELYRAISGSGARYTNAAAEWWEHQGEAAYSVAGTNVFRGRIVPVK